jgi:hypothetical protein
MFDFAKLHIRRGWYRRQLHGNPLLQWRPHTPADGYAPLNCSLVAKWGAWTFFSDGEEVKEVRGSFHQHYHGGTNWKPFTRPQFLAVVEDLCDAFGIFAGELRILNVEIGANVRPPAPSVELLPLFLFHRKQRPKGMEDTDRGIVFRHPGRYRLKAYDKGHQYPEAGELLRFEVHVDRMKLVQFIRTLEDLTRPETWEAARAFLLRRFDEVFIVEPAVELERLRPAQRALLANATDPAFWMAQTPNKRERKRRSIERCYQRHAARSLKAELRIRIEEATRLVGNACPGPVSGDERHALGKPGTNGDPFVVTFDTTRAGAPANTRVVRHHYVDSIALAMR